MIQTIVPTSEEHWLELRTKVLTSTDVGALFGISPYITAYELWHRKKDGYHVAFEPNQRMKLGTALQDAIAHYAAKENGWTIRRMDEFIQNVDLRLGSSFDFSLDFHKSVDTENSQDNSYEKAMGRPVDGLLEIKNVDYIQFKKEWIEKENGEIEAPLHIEIQCQHQLLVSGRSFLYLGALIGGNDLKLIKRTPDEKIFSAITARAREFWQSIEDNNPPAPNFETDSSFIARMFSFAEPGKVIQIDDEHIKSLALQHTVLGDEESRIKKQRDAIKAEILTKIGDAEKVLGDGYSIDCGITGSSPRNFVMPAFRRFRVFQKKEK